MKNRSEPSANSEPIAKVAVPASEIWFDDLLDRRDDAKFLIEFLTARVQERIAATKPASYVLNLDAGWGRGKTFFLTRLGRQLSQDQFPVVYINAWEDDHAADPLVPVLQALDTYFAQHKPKKSSVSKLWQATKKNGLSIIASGAGAAAKALTKKYAGDLLEDVSEATSETIECAVKEGVDTSVAAMVDRYAEHLIKDFQKAKSSIESFKDGLRGVVDAGDKPLFILIDELDRCRPSYAIGLLERIKHLFAVDGVIFVVATNTEQLQHAVSAVYGSAFDGRRYLHRFFDRTYQFSEPSCEAFVENLFAVSGFDGSQCSTPGVQADKLFLGFMQIYGLSLRDAEQCFDILRTVVTMWPPRKVKIELVAMVPFIVAHQQGSTALLDALRTGHFKDIKQLVKSPDAMPIKFSVEGGSPFRRESRNTSLLQVSMEFIQRANNTLPEITKQSSDGHHAWIVERYREEFGAVHGNSYTEAAPPYSIVARYGDLVSCAGRLTK